MAQHPGWPGTWLARVPGGWDPSRRAAALTPPYDKESLTMTTPESPPFDTTTTDRLLVTTRSVRRRLDLRRPVEPEVIMECLNLAVQAPTASGVQRWRWMIVTDPEKRAALADLYRQGNVEFQKMMAGRGAHESDAFYESANFLIDHLQEVPVHVVPCIVGRPEGRGQEGAIALYASIMPAAWSFMLALRSRSLGSVWTTLHLTNEREAAELLGIPEDVTQVGLLPVAYTLGTDFKVAHRQPAEEVTYWNSWANTSGSGA
jgi:nitroreductase